MQLYVSIVPKELINSEVGEDLIDQCVNQFRRLEEMSGGRFTAEDFIYAAAMSDNVQLWVACNDDAVVCAAVLTKFKTYPRSTWFEITGIAGFNSKYWADDMITTLFTFAADHGIYNIEIPHYREGWVRALSKYGFKKTISGLEVRRGQPRPTNDHHPEG